MYSELTSHAAINTPVIARIPWDWRVALHDVRALDHSIAEGSEGPTESSLVGLDWLQCVRVVVLFGHC